MIFSEDTYHFYNNYSTEDIDNMVNPTYLGSGLVFKFHRGRDMSVFFQLLAELNNLMYADADMSNIGDIEVYNYNNIGTYVFSIYR